MRYELKEYQPHRIYDQDELEAADALLILSRTALECGFSTNSSTTDMSTDEQSIKTEESTKRRNRRRRATSPSPPPVSPLPWGNSKKKPRWQELERLSLFHAIVKDKQLDDMSTFNWDRISKAFGGQRAGKACKDQWRRELLPALMNNIKP